MPLAKWQAFGLNHNALRHTYIQKTGSDSWLTYPITSTSFFISRYINAFTQAYDISIANAPKIPVLHWTTNTYLTVGPSKAVSKRCGGGSKLVQEQKVREQSL